MAKESEEQKSSNVLIRDMSGEEVDLLNNFKQEIGEKTSSKALLKLLHVHNRDKQEISGLKKEVDKLDKKLSETKNKLTLLQTQVKEYLDTKKRLESLEESLSKSLASSR